jgi:DNA processing protein
MDAVRAAPAVPAARTGAALETVLRLAMVPGIGPGRIAALLARFGSVERVLGASAAGVAALPGFGSELAGRVAGASGPEGRERARRAMETLERIGAGAITPEDAAYPEAFRVLPDPPFVLFTAGDLSLLGLPGVGVVGTRAPTEYGRRAAARLSHDVARAGYAIISGMAKGIDATAHGAALDAGGATVGVLGHGIDRVYPQENRRLFERMREAGLLVSELPPGEEPLPGNFPRRNRLIAALAEGVLVVEMGERSGARHTVDYALEQGKEVFSVPGPIGSPASAGTNQLLKEGARLVTSADDILEELRGVGRGAVPAGAKPTRVPTAPAPAPPDLAGDEAAVFAALTDEARHVDTIAAATRLPTGAILSALLTLELRDLAESLPGKHYRRR